MVFYFLQCNCKHKYFFSCGTKKLRCCGTHTNITLFVAQVHILRFLKGKHQYYGSCSANLNNTLHVKLLCKYVFFKYRLRNIFFQNLHFTKKFSFSFLNIYTKCVNMSCTHTQYKQSVTLFFYCVQIIMRVKTWLSYSYKDGKLK